MEAYRGVLKIFLLILIMMFIYLYGDKVGLYEPYKGDVRTEVYITENGTLNLEGSRYRVDFGCEFYTYQLKAINSNIETISMMNDIMSETDADARRKLEQYEISLFSLNKKNAEIAGDTAQEAFYRQSEASKKYLLGIQIQEQKRLITQPEILSKLKEESLTRANKLERIKTLVLGSIKDCQDPEDSFWAAFKSHYNSQRIDERGLTP